MKKTGQLLKDKRESVKLSISEVALATKINPKILAAIEIGDETNLPAKTFLKGFLRSYALFLKMDADEILRTYQEETGAPPPERPHQFDSQSPNSPRRNGMGEENSSGLRTAAVVVIVLLIGVIIGVRELIEKYQREKTVESSPVKVSPLAQPPVIQEAKPPPSPTPSPELVAPLPAPVPAPAPETTPAPVQVATPEPAPAPEPAAESKPEEKPPEPAATRKTLKNEIILEALDKVDVRFKVKDEMIKLSLGPTQVHTIHTDQPVTFDFSDGGAVNIILNGRERGVPGDLGKPKQITIP